MLDSSVLPHVMPTEVGIHDLSSSQQRKSWIPAFAGMTEWRQCRWVNHSDT
jgi:hypothetical protein